VKEIHFTPATTLIIKKSCFTA